MVNKAEVRTQHSAVGHERGHERGHARGRERELECDNVQQDPLVQFTHWLNDAQQAGLPEPNAMVLSTATSVAAPSSRSVLLKEVDEIGLVFFTNYHSRKAQQIRENDAVCALFPWYALHRQVIIEGKVQSISAAQSATYFHSRPRLAQIGAWASRQSEPLASRQILEERIAQTTSRFAEGEIPLPEFWGGYRICPHRVEFWQGREHRLHDRILYLREKDSDWSVSRLFP